MRYDDQTDMGGTQEVFLTTQWSLIEGVKADQDKDKALIGHLLGRYWKPVYCYLRRKGYDNEQAKDLTQAFFHEVVLNRGLVQRADQAKGRFRSFLLHALGQYVTKQGLKERALKRIPKEKLVSLDLVEAPPVLPESIADSTAEESYHYTWVSAMLAYVLSDVEAECCEQGMQIHWRLFQARIIQPILGNEPLPSITELCETYGIGDAKKASNMIITVKRRFQTMLMHYVRSTVLSEKQASEELKDLLQFFPKSAQHFE
ncbi:MAG: RNA polymerase sigma factor [Planctomycetota bacterium]|jgi:RNA polymerase sigma-70 factor (ECF subfamily)